SSDMAWSSRSQRYHSNRAGGARSRNRAARRGQRRRVLTQPGKECLRATGSAQKMGSARKVRARTYQPARTAARPPGTGGTRGEGGGGRAGGAGGGGGETRGGPRRA